eukprot:COSAG04_NODE_6218_length_1381_cov_2.324493_3_plen_72_part_00
MSVWIGSAFACAGAALPRGASALTTTVSDRDSVAGCATAADGGAAERGERGGGQAPREVSHNLFPSLISVS